MGDSLTYHVMSEAIRSREYPGRRVAPGPRVANPDRETGGPETERIKEMEPEVMSVAHNGINVHMKRQIQGPKVSSPSIGTESGNIQPVLGSMER